MDEENVLDFLTSLEAMDLPDRIEEVNAKILAKIVEETDFVAVLFCKSLFLLYILIGSQSKVYPGDLRNHLEHVLQFSPFYFPIEYRAYRFAVNCLSEKILKYVCQIFWKTKHIKIK